MDGMKWMAAGALALAAVGAQAQMQYNCRTSNGTIYQSTQPCGSLPGSTTTGRSSGVTYYGPSDNDRPRYQPPPPSIGEAPQHLKYMSPRCASLHDAMRTARARGLTGDTISEMRRNYQGECGENEREAYTMLSQERGDQYQAKRADQQAERQAKERTALQQQQCGESKRILITKRARTDLNEGEKAELQRFEQNYRERCS